MCKKLFDWLFRRGVHEFEEIEEFIDDDYEENEDIMNCDDFDEGEYTEIELSEEAQGFFIDDWDEILQLGLETLDRLDRTIDHNQAILERSERLVERR